MNLEIIIQMKIYRKKKELLDNNSKLSEGYEKLQENYLKEKTEQK